MKKINTTRKRLKSDEFLETMKRIKVIDKEIMVLGLERELLVHKVKTGKK